LPDAKGNLTPAEQADLANLMLALGLNPKARKDVAKLVRQHADDPRVKKFVDQFKDVTDDPAPVDPKPVDPKDKPLTQAQLDERFAEEEGKRREREAKAQRESSRQRLVESGRFTADTMKELDKFIEDNGYENLSYDHAATLYAAEKPPENQRPTIGSSRVWEMPTDKEYLKNPKKAALNAAYKVVDELRGTRRA
jgi:hypothetical protein